MKFKSFIFLLFFHLCNFCSVHGGPNSLGTILFNTVGRPKYNFDIYTLPILNDDDNSYPPPSSSKARELKLTDSVSVNYNGYFPNSQSSPLSLLSSQNHSLLPKLRTSTSLPFVELIYVTERNGSSSIYYDALFYDSASQLGSRSDLELELPARIQVPLVGNQQFDGQVSVKDRPSLAGEFLLYVSTHENSEVQMKSWAAVYSTHLRTRFTRRLTPKGVSDFSPAVSPSGVWTAVASYGEKPWGGEVNELRTEIYVFLTRDGSRRVKIVDHGSWPSWVDDSTIYFHRRSDEDGWMSVYRATLPRVGPVGTNTVVVERVTPPGLHAFTPATSPGNKDFIALATRRLDTDYRQIELFDLVRNEFKEVTRPIAPQVHHLNPFLSPDSTRIGYHRCRGAGNQKPAGHLLRENIQSPVPGLLLFRMDEPFPSFSPKGDRIAYAGLPGLYVMNRDGSNRREVFEGMAFSTAWDPVREGVIYTSTGPIFAPLSTDVDIVSINVDDENPSYKKLTEGGENNAFPSPSPDGKWIVFRSGRSGYKNLYVMDAVEGEKGGIRRLTEGPWIDTHCNWSPDGEWIAFASDRGDPSGSSVQLYLIHPNGTGLRKVFRNWLGGQAAHPWFSPDGKRIVFTTGYAGASAEPISTLHQFQSAAEVFIAKIDGSEIQRMTHNIYEDGTPTWGPAFVKPADVARPTDGPGCSFSDYHWLNVKPENGSKAARMASTKAP
ncbi:hypothetical protein Ancab_037448 [Ancistrocladus abbreviatus]